MCLMLYIATASDLPLRASPELTIEAVQPNEEAVKQWFTLPSVRFVGAHTGCSCGFPSIVAEEPMDYFDGLFSGDRSDDLRSVTALLGLLGEVLAESEYLELYPPWNGDESMPPKGRIEWDLAGLDADRFFFIERFIYVVRGRPA